MDLEKVYFHWFWGDNNIRQERPNYLANMDIGVCIKFDYGDGMFASYEDFFENIADVQFVHGDRPGEDEVERILTEAWNFLGIEERILEGDLDEGKLDDLL